MIEIEVKNVEKFHGSNHVLKGVSFDVMKGERVAFIGKNGCGKSTLFNILAEKEKQDKGDIFVSRNVTIGMVEQIPAFKDNAIASDIINAAFEKIINVRTKMNEIEQEMNYFHPTDDVLRRYGELQHLFESLDGYAMASKISRVCNGLGIPLELLENKFLTLSGGEKTRILLAKAILMSPDILLLDEPTNHLDFYSIEWMEDFLKTYKGTVLIISHDRFFLDKVVNKVVEIEEGKASVFKGDYSDYQKAKTEILAKQQHEYELQQQKIRKMESTVKTLHQWGNKANEMAFHHAASRLQEKVIQLKKQPKPGFERNLDSESRTSDFSSQDVVIIENASVSFGERKLFENLDITIRKGEKVALIGPNGSGKSTLIRAVMGEISLDNCIARFGQSVKVAYLPQKIVFRNPDLSLLDTIRNELEISEGEAKALLVRYNFHNEDWHKRTINISGGELMRLKVCCLMQRETNLLLLDEPTNHLDIRSREWIEKILETYEGTVVFVSHDRYFINKFASRIIEFEDGLVNDYKCDFSSYMEIRLKKQKNEMEKTNNCKKIKNTGRITKNESNTDKYIVKLEAKIEELENRLKIVESTLSDESADYINKMKYFDECLNIRKQIDELYGEWYMLVEVN